MSLTLYRTARPRFPAYSPDGKGRDYYIKFDNGGYWADQFHLKKSCDYERPKYTNFHTLFHQAAPIKYYGNGKGRETYILQKNGFYHDQKPLKAYQLTDFLRTKDEEIIKKKCYKSLAEKRYNQQLRNLEKDLIHRLYKTPMKKNLKILSEDVELPKMCKTVSHKLNHMRFNKTSASIEEKKFENAKKLTRASIGKLVNKSVSNYIDPRNDLRLIDSRGKYSRTFDLFKYKPKIDIKKFHFKKYKIVAE